MNNLNIIEYYYSEYSNNLNNLNKCFFYYIRPYLDFEGHVYAGIERTSNYFGKSNFASDALFDGCLDDIKIFNRGLSQAEIEIEMNAVRTPNVVGSTTLAPSELPAGNI